jgi:hypothetical protein
MAAFYDAASWDLGIGQTVRCYKDGQEIVGVVVDLKREFVLKYVYFEDENGEVHKAVHDDVLIIGYPKK